MSTVPARHAPIGPWQRELSASERDAAGQLLADVRAADHRSPEGLPGGSASYLLVTVDGRLVAIAWRENDDPAELYVHPRHRRRGIGRRLADAVLAAGPVWAHGTFPAARALAAALGAEPVRQLLQLRRPLDETFPVELPEGVILRAFRPGRDDAEFLAVNARAFAWHPEQGRLDRPALEREMAEPWFDADGFFLAVPAADTGRILGFHWTKVHPADPDTGKPIGEVYVLGADPDAPVRHLGRPLTAAGLNYLRSDRGLDAVLLYVESDNAPALAIYRRLGFTDHATDTVFAR